MLYEPNTPGDWLRTSEALKLTNFNSSESEWLCAPDRDVSVTIWRWRDRDYVTLVSMIGGTCRSGVRVPLQRIRGREEWR